MSGYEVAPAELFSAEAMITETADDVRAQLARLRTAADDLLGHGWRGSAASAFARAWQEWDEGARLVLAGLAETARALGATARDYEGNELATVSMVKGAA